MSKMELTEKQQENKKEDKKALRKFFVIMLAAFVVGVGVGSSSTFLGNIMALDGFKERALELAFAAAVYGSFVFTTALLIISIVLYKKCRKEYSAWDEEEEEVLCRMETKISYVLWFSNLMMFGSYFFFSAGVWAVELNEIGCAIEAEDTGYWIPLVLVFLHIIYGLAAACVMQQKVVNLSKEINPEKQGSVYDMKFQNKWLEHCDEAERYTAYKCSFKTFKTMQVVGMVLWVVCLVGQMSFGTGAFATIIVAIFLIIQTSVYSVQGIYFAKHPSEVMK